MWINVNLILDCLNRLIIELIYEITYTFLCFTCFSLLYFEREREREKTPLFSQPSAPWTPCTLQAVGQTRLVCSGTFRQLLLNSTLLLCSFIHSHSVACMCLSGNSIQPFSLPCQPTVVWTGMNYHRQGRGSRRAQTGLLIGCGPGGVDPGCQSESRTLHNINRVRVGSVSIQTSASLSASWPGIGCLLPPGWCSWQQLLLPPLKTPNTRVRLREK